MNSQVPFPHPLPPTCPGPCCRRSLPGQQGSSGSRDAQLSSPSPGSLGEAVRWTKLGWGGLFPGTEGETAASTTCPAGRRPGTVWDSRRHPLSQQETPVPCEVRAGLAAQYKVIPSRQLWAGGERGWVPHAPDAGQRAPCPLHSSPGGLAECPSGVSPPA